MSNMETALTLRFRDQASAGMNRMKQEAVRTAEQVARTSTDSQRKIQSAFRESSQVFNRSVAEQSRIAERAAEARGRLVIHSENAIQREIAQTEAAYQRLARQGVTSASEQQRAFVVMTSKVKALRAEMRGVSLEEEKLANRRSGGGTINKAMAVGTAAAGAGVMIGADVMRSDLLFEQNLLEMKQNSGMTTKQAAEIRRLAIEGSTAAMQTPLSMLEAAKALARAGEKYETIAAKMNEAARSATVFRATPEEIANMDVDLSQKLGIRANRMGQVHNMLYYHGNAGRFEGNKLAQYAPELFNSVASLGIGGERGLNFTGALTQVLMKSATVKEPGKVATLMQQGLGHIVDGSYIKNIKKATGIDIHKYAPKGRFYGEGGVDGLLDLADAMKSKGLTDPFKLNRAGFKDQETIKFFMALMKDSKSIREEMKNADTAAKSDQISVDLAEMKQSNPGKVKSAEITVEKKKLGETGAGLTSFIAEHAPILASENSILTNIIGLGAAAGGGALTQRIANASGSGLWQRMIGSASPAPALLPRMASSPLFSLSAISSFTTREEDNELRNGDATWKRLRAQYSQKDIDAARKQFQPWYQFGEGYATENEQWLKQYKSQPVASQNTERQSQQEALVAKTSEQLNQAAQLLANPKPVPIEVVVRVMNGDIVAQVNRAQMNLAGRY